MQHLIAVLLVAGLAAVTADYYCSSLAGRPTCLWCAHGACMGKKTWYRKDWCYNHCPEPSEPVDTSAGAVLAASQIKNAIDESVDPCNNFFQFACGNWVKENKATQDNPVRRALDDMQTVLEDSMMQVMEMLSGHEHHGDDDAWLNKAIDFYSTCKRDGEDKGYNVQDIVGILDSFGGWPLINRSTEVGPDLNFGGLSGLLYHDAMVDTMYDDPLVSQAGNSPSIMIQRKFFRYMNGDDYQNYRANMEKAASRLALQLGVVLDKTKLEKDIADVANFQNRLASVNLTGKYERNQLKTFGLNYPNLGFQEYLRKLMTGDIYDALPREFNISTTSFSAAELASLNTIVADSDPVVVRNWVISQFVMQYFERVGFHGHHKLKSSIHLFKNAKPLNLTCTENLLNYMDLATGRINAQYIEPETLKLNAATIGSYILEAYHDQMSDIDWLDEESKQGVFNKLAGFKVSYGWPDWIMNDLALDDWYSGIHVYPNISFAGLLNQVSIAQNDRQFSFLVHPIYSQLEMFPSPLDVVNAEYVPEQNHLYILAGILQPPYYDNQYPMVINFGGVGIVIGHEMGHGYDRDGVYFDYKGRQQLVLSDSVYNTFYARTTCLARQYNQYCLYPNICEDGEISVTENEADTLGVRMAFQGYRKWRAAQGKGVRLPTLEKYSSDQLFFMNYGRALCADYTQDVAPEFVNQVHAADPLRILGATRNMVEFAEAFNCPDKSYMNPSDRCRIWTSDTVKTYA